MLINIRTSEIQSNNFNSIPLALFATILLNYALQPILPYYMARIKSYYSKIYNVIYYLHSIIVVKGDVKLPFHGVPACAESVRPTKDLNRSNVMFVTSNNWDGNMTETSHISTIGNILYTSYNIWLFIASFILLLAMTGAIIITIKQDTDKQ